MRILYFFFIFAIILRNGEEWHRIRQSIAPKLMRPKTVEENIDNFNTVSEDAISRFVKLKKASGPDEHLPDLEGELSRFSTESKLKMLQLYDILAGGSWHVKLFMFLLNYPRKNILMCEI